MTVRNLDLGFRPQSVAVVGASNREGAVGSVVLRNIIRGGFAGTIYPVNLKYDVIEGLRCYHRPSDLPAPPDLAIIMTPPSTVPGLIAELGAVGCKAAVVITAGVGATDGLRQAMLDAAKPHLMRIIGPNTIGLLSPHVALNASFAHLAPRPGKLGLISQSGAIVSSVIDWAAAEDVGFSQILSLGDMADVDVGDCLNWLAADPETSAILMYLESIPAPRKFMSAARAAARIKPVIAIKPGRHIEAAKAAMTHTGSLAGADNVVDAALHRAGVIRVKELEQLFYAAEITARFSPLRSGRVAVVTNGGGAGVLVVDELIDRKASIAELSPETMAHLDAALPATWSRSNPVDIIGDAPPERYTAAIAAVADDPGVDAILVMNCPTAVASPLAAADAVGRLAEAGRVNGKPLLACWLGAEVAEPARAILRRAGVATVNTPTAAAEGVSLLTRWSELRRQLERIPAATQGREPDKAAAARVLETAASEGRAILTEPEAKSVLAAYGIAVPQIVVATSPEDVERAAAGMLQTNGAVVVKMLSRTITHKSDLGGVALNLTTPIAAREAAEQITARVTTRYPEGLDGFAVQPMVKRPGAQELLIGLTTDASFGPIVVFGAGGTGVEVINDTATGLVPLDEVLAGDLIDATRISRLLAGFRDVQPADRVAIIGALTGLSQLAIDFPAIVAVDINPLLADATGAIALDARIQIDIGRAAGAPDHLVIRPYPTNWNTSIDASDGGYEVRPILPADALLYPDFLERVTQEDLRRRFLVPTNSISSEMLVRLSQLDYDREMAFVALNPQSGKLAAIARISADPDHETAEFGILVRSDLQGNGLGRGLMRHLIAYARADGLHRIRGTVLRENTAMLQMAAALGFTQAAATGAADLVQVELDLRKHM
ncbi:GNAT family N-acetyltransferase [Devosia sp.]|uniref:bifunctional acetate--CoA ligase family protein/GNAT family N-acetyltransferase n=1 Tax=Devosia sp. TaxID=1871048 RepID=UPI003BAB5334